jgi:hypothetical protein
MWEALRLVRRWQEPAWENDSEILDALHTALVVRYSRCFATGVDIPRLTIADLSTATPRDQELHQYLLDIRNKHVAHPVSQMEVHDAYLSVVMRDDGIPLVAAVNSGFISYLGMPSELGSEVEQLIGEWLNLVNELTQLECERLLPIARSLSADEILSLPLGPGNAQWDPNRRRQSRSRR